MLATSPRVPFAALTSSRDSIITRRDEAAQTREKHDRDTIETRSRRGSCPCSRINWFLLLRSGVVQSTFLVFPVKSKFAPSKPANYMHYRSRCSFDSSTRERRTCRKGRKLVSRLEYTCRLRRVTRKRSRARVFSYLIAYDIVLSIIDDSLTSLIDCHAIYFCLCSFD